MELRIWRFKSEMAKFSFQLEKYFFERFWLLYGGHPVAKLKATTAISIWIANEATALEPPPPTPPPPLQQQQQLQLVGIRFDNIHIHTERKREKITWIDDGL